MLPWTLLCMRTPLVLAVRWLTGVLVLPWMLAIGAAACEDLALSRRSADSGFSPPPRYWLKNTTLLGWPGGKPERYVDGPLLVELLPKGRVRSAKPGKWRVEGYLPRDVLQEPQPGWGLMLYAQEHTELRFGARTGQVIGQLHPGAFVSVVLDGRGGALVGSLPFREKGVIGYVSAGALRITPREFPKTLLRIGGRSYVTGRVESALRPGTQVPDPERRLYWWGCEPLWVWRDTGLASQYVEGTEIIGEPNYLISWPDQPRQPFAVDCRASAVLQKGDQLVLKTVRYTTEPVSTLPPGFSRIQDSASESVVDAARQGGTVHWLTISDAGVRCSAWRFESITQRQGSSAVVFEGKLRLISSSPGGSRGRFWYPVRVIPSEQGKLVRVEMDPLQPTKYPLCCEFAYIVVAASETEFHMLGRRLSEGAIAYRPDEVERWYRTGSACQDALPRAQTVLSTQPELAPTLGAHQTDGNPSMAYVANRYGWHAPIER